MYLEEIQKSNLEHINKLNIYSAERFMSIDLSTRRNLEITETMREKARKGTLIWVMDATKTAMGARMLRSFVERPLIDVVKINERLNSVEVLKNNPILRADICDCLNKIYDIERLIGKIVYGNANARDLVALKLSLMQLPELKQLLLTIDDELISKLTENLDLVEEIKELIEKAIIDDPPITVKEGGIIKKGYNEEVDRLREAGTNGKNWLAELEANEREKTGIKNLRISFNKVFGYYIEVTKSNLSMVPDYYIRKQTLTTGERYIIPELKEMEDTILGAEEKIVVLEYDLFNEIRKVISGEIERLQKTASVIANIDALSSLAEIAEKNNYVKPVVDDGDTIEIKDGRHPVI
jgi:DNA mismatch repair protein MutS